MRAALAAALVVGVLLSGCSDEPKGDAQGLVLQEVDNTATEGSISGVTVDDAIRPVAGVNVTLLGAGRNVRTDADGLFVFDGLEPGLYTLSTDAIPTGERRFLSIQTTAEVAAGATTKVKIVLPPDPTPQPYSVTLAFDGFFEVGSGFVDEVLELYAYNRTVGPLTTPSPTCTCAFAYRADDQPFTHVVEIVHEDTVEPPMPTFWTFDLESDVDGNSNDLWFCEDNPCLAHVPGSNYSSEARNFTIGVWSDPAWVAVQQPFQLFITLFYAAPAPEGWSYLDGQPA